MCNQTRSCTYCHLHSRSMATRLSRAAAVLCRLTHWRPDDRISVGTVWHICACSAPSRTTQDALLDVRVRLKCFACTAICKALACVRNQGRHLHTGTAAACDSAAYIFHPPPVQTQQCSPCCLW